LRGQQLNICSGEIKKSAKRHNKVTVIVDNNKMEINKINNPFKGEFKIKVDQNLKPKKKTRTHNK